MTAPALWSAAIDPVLAARRHLVSFSTVREVLGPETGDTVWLFVRSLGVLVEGSGLAAAVLSAEGGWTRPNRHNTASFPRLVVAIYADPTRGSNGEIVRYDAEVRARRAWLAFDAVLHRPTGFSEVWGAEPDADPPDPGLRVWGSQALLYPEPVPVEQWQGGVLFRAEYGLNVG